MLFGPGLIHFRVENKHNWWTQLIRTDLRFSVGKKYFLTTEKTRLPSVAKLVVIYFCNRFNFFGCYGFWRFSVWVHWKVASKTQPILSISVLISVLTLRWSNRSNSHTYHLETKWDIVYATRDIVYATQSNVTLAMCYPWRLWHKICSRKIS